jgi:hypothetical protein
MNPVLEILASALELLAGGALDYKTPHGKDNSRIEAGIRLVQEDAVKPTEAPGVYLVKSNDRSKKGVWYYVCAEWGSLSCTCEDATISPHNPSGICLHQIAAVTMEAMRMTFAQMDAIENAQRSEAA